MVSTVPRYYLGVKTERMTPKTPKLSETCALAPKTAVVTDNPPMTTAAIAVHTRSRRRENRDGMSDALTSAALQPARSVANRGTASDDELLSLGVRDAVALGDLVNCLTSRVQLARSLGGKCRRGFHLCSPVVCICICFCGLMFRAVYGRSCPVEQVSRLFYERSVDVRRVRIHLYYHYTLFRSKSTALSQNSRKTLLCTNDTQKWLKFWL